MVSLALLKATNGEVMLDKVTQAFHSRDFTEFECSDNFISLTLSQIKKYPLGSVFSPKPSEDDLSISLSSKIEGQRQKAIDHFFRVSQEAARAQCRYVHVWPGRIEGDDLEKKDSLLRQSYQETSSSYEEEKETFLSRRALFRNGFIENFCRSLYQLSKVAPDTIFCLPTTQKLFELPLGSQELEWIFDEVKAKNISYWPSLSTLHLNEKMGFEESEKALASYSNLLAGVHFDDAVGLENLYPPGVGEVNFKGMSECIPSSVKKVIRYHHTCSEYELVTGFDYLRDEGVI